MSLPPPRALQLPLFAPAPSGWSAPAEFLRLDGVRRLSLDVETRDDGLASGTGPGWLRGRAAIVGLAVGTDDSRRAYYPVGHEGGGNLDRERVVAWARSELAGFRGEVVGANILYDLEGLAVDWDVRMDDAAAFHDVQVAEPLLDEWAFSYSLEAISGRRLGEGKAESGLRAAGALYGWKTDRDVKGNLWRLPAADVGPYAEGDVDLPLRVFAAQEALLAAEGLERVYDVERRLIPLLLAMKLRGVRVDSAAAERARVWLSRELAAQVAEFRRLTTAKAEIMAPESFAAALEARGLDVPRTKVRVGKTGRSVGGAYSVTKPWIERNQRDPAVRALQKARKLFVTINTFIDGHVLGHAIGGRLHPTLKQLKGGGEGGGEGGTIARFASVDPNLQNVPSRREDWDEDDLPSVVRGVFVPEEGEQWESQDESQVEYRLMVDCAVGRGAEEARERYRSDPETDYHKFAATMLGVDPEDKVRRKRVKNTNFAYGYGAGVPKLAETFGCSVPEAEAFMRDYNRALPFAKATFARAVEVGEAQGFVRTVLGRKGRFPFWERAGSGGRRESTSKMTYEEAVEKYGAGNVQRADTYKALNRKLQGSGADIMKKSMIDAWEAGLFAPSALGAPLLTVHDELDLSVPRTAAADEACLELKRLSETCVSLKVPLMVTRERGSDWGHMEKVR